MFHYQRGMDKDHLISHFIDDFPKQRGFQFSTFDCEYFEETMINKCDLLTEIKPFWANVDASRSFGLPKYIRINNKYPILNPHNHPQSLGLVSPSFLGKSLHPWLG